MGRRGAGMLRVVFKMFYSSPPDRWRRNCEISLRPGRHLEEGSVIACLAVLTLFCSLSVLHAHTLHLPGGAGCCHPGLPVQGPCEC